MSDLRHCTDPDCGLTWDGPCTDCPGCLLQAAALSVSQQAQEIQRLRAALEGAVWILNSEPAKAAFQLAWLHGFRVTAEHAARVEQIHAAIRAAGVEPQEHA